LYRWARRVGLQRSGTDTPTAQIPPPEPLIAVFFVIVLFVTFTKSSERSLPGALVAALLAFAD
jgi:hypothetical protein